MTLENIVKITGVMLLFIIPFLVMGINNKKKDTKLLQRLRLLAEKTNGSITHYDLWSNTLLIGIDNNTCQIFFIRQEENKETSKQIELSEIQTASVLNNSREINNKEGSSKISDEIGLLLSYKGQRQKEEVLTFYNSNFDGLMLKGELQLADKWSRIINDSIASYQKQVI
ncbi:hypothetical protein [Adhaeribacter aquaticus]|uniref:hypothetical protein n=1 Tax=Adhaeribacter aquaticus TaxID=299567 RepID=UPI00047A70A3|nr:hypothetical protein [Adhaeribacter aquaticus]